jgi:hypothetical protein
MKIKASAIVGMFVLCSLLPLFTSSAAGPDDPRSFRPAGDHKVDAANGEGSIYPIRQRR